MVASAVLWLAALTAPAADPYQIFDNAKQAWAMQRYPAVVDYTLEVTAVNQGVRQTRHYHEYWSANDNGVTVQPPVSDEQLADPYKPSPGVNVMGWNVGGPREGQGVKGDLIGVPALAPNYSFGIISYTPPGDRTPAELVEQIRREYHDDNPQKIAELQRKTGFKTIAEVTSTARQYRISLAGLETVGNHRDYHLILQPLTEPGKYRLRDLWIDAASYATDRLRVAGNFEDHATESVPWLVRFAHVGGATYIKDESAEQPLEGYRSRMYDSYTLSFVITGTGRRPFWVGGAGANPPLDEP